MRKKTPATGLPAKAKGLNSALLTFPLGTPSVKKADEVKNTKSAVGASRRVEMPNRPWDNCCNGLESASIADDYLNR